ncbi:MAG TPA: hypothetical protein VG407_11080 [Caulobacteraceae bacterium]|jgi:hypothetical protein|nr:hypothetical protein [Caulobacteraceae bacterium]
MSLFAKTSIFLTGSVAGVLFSAAVMGSAADAYQPAARLSPSIARASTANCAPGFSVTDVWGSPVASPTPTTLSYGWTCITPVIHCNGAPAWFSAQALQPGNGVGRVTYKCSWIRL